MTVLRRAVFSGGWWMAERFAALFATLAVNVVVVRSLGPAGYGELAYLLAVVALLMPLVHFGLNGLIARAVLEHPGDEAAIVRASMAWRLAGCLAALAVGFAYWAFFDPHPQQRLVLLVLMLAQCASTLQALELVFQARMEARRLVAWRGGALAIGAALKLAAAVLTRDPVVVAWACAAEFVLLGAAHALAYHRYTQRWPWPGREPRWTAWIARRAPWLLASGMAEIVYLKIDIVMLERMRGPAEAGTYAVAARLSEIWYVVPVVIAASMFPALWSGRDDAHGYRRGLQAGFDLLCALAIVLAVAMHWLAAPLVAALFGAEFIAAAPILIVHVWAGVFVFMRALLSRWLIAEDLLRYSLVTHLAGAVVNVLANLWLIPRYGALGAAIATVVSYACAGWLALFLSARTRPIGLMMGRALLLPLRLGDLRSYWRALRGQAAPAT